MWNFHVLFSDQMDFISELRTIATDEELKSFKKKVINTLITSSQSFTCPFCLTSFTAWKNNYAHIRNSWKVLKSHKSAKVEQVEKVELEEASILNSSNPCEGMLQIKSIL